MIRRAFTLIEVLAVLALTAATLLIGVRIGHAVIVQREQEQFFAALIDEWDDARHSALLVGQTGSLSYSQSRIAFQLTDSPGLQWELPMPASLTLVNKEGVPLTYGSHVLISKNAGTFKSVRTLYFVRQQGGRVALSFNMSWGMITRVDD
ncbi:prepilin-type N-terminal cleavage/methylation domain-containing protein [Lacticaseibacillus kribbianus]|uniref:prepilin-type N-terminal cleavage/methylation domain-containing protein n=1 Tax=Lacticaseibacillus kribbianus TaxID=2926292 RepID=UPI001CD1AA29|nr:prepilin-type N-terminal cleavage/methylation domain-containing protein [Lacticaseibacillus kribbianus]